MKESCIRNEGRDKDLCLEDWRKFFRNNPTPYVYSCADLTKPLFEPGNIVGVISDVEFHDSYFTYNITPQDESLVQNGSMFYNLSTTIEPVVVSVKRYGCPPDCRILGIEYTNREFTKDAC